MEVKPMHLGRAGAAPGGQGITPFILIFFLSLCYLVVQPDYHLSIINFNIERTEKYSMAIC